MSYKATDGYAQIEEIESTGVQMGDNNLKEGKIITLGKVPDITVEPYPFIVGDNVLFNTHKALKHGAFWYILAKDILAYDANK